MEEQIRAYARLRLARAQEESTAAQALTEAERFVARLERYLREIGAL